MNRKTLVLAVVLVVSLLSASTTAEPLPEVTPITESVTIRADSGAELRVPPGMYVPTPAWLALDAELKRAQDAETRLAAENKSLRTSAAESGPGWGTVWIVAGALAAGIIGGAVAY